MNQFWSIIILLFCWLVSLVEPSGWGHAHNLTDKVNLLFGLIGLFFFLSKPLYGYSLCRKIWSGLFIALMLFAMVLIPYLSCGNGDSWTYLISFIVVYVISQCTITSKVIFWSGIGYAIGGITILFIYVNGEILNGWNDNSIAMVGLFSFLYFSIVLMMIRSQKRFFAWNIVTLIFFQNLFSTDSRSVMLFIILSIVAILFANKSRKILSIKLNRYILLLIPLFISLLVICFCKTSVFESLNMWSLLKFDKPLFNGREILWNEGLDELISSGYVGTGEFLINYHNSAIAALAVYGILGFIVFIIYFGRAFNFISRWLADDIILGGLVSFVLIYLQQSLELGFISPEPNLIPYAILGLTLGRIRTLQTSPQFSYG